MQKPAPKQLLMSFYGSNKHHTMKVTRLAPAKINLMLHVVGRLADGYHHLQSLIAFVSVGDTLTGEKATSFHLTVDGPFAQHVPLKNNSISQAVHWLAKKYPGIEHVHIHLTKNLPVASGIGGGTSDAAATIAILLRIFNIFLSKPEKEALILESGVLGADVPCCLAYQLGWGPVVWIDSSGRETLPLSFSKTSLPGVMVLVNPGVAISTPGIFKMIHPPYMTPQNFQNIPEDLLPYLKAQKNDLMAAAITQAPEVQRAIDILQTIPGCLLARMSGSGATCFAIVKDEETAQIAQTRLLTNMPKAWVSIAELQHTQ